MGLEVVVAVDGYLEWLEKSAVPDKKQRTFAHFLPRKEEKVLAC